MRTITINKDLAITIEALPTRRHIEALKDQGFAVSTMSIGGVTADQWDDFVDALVRACCPDQADQVIEALKDLPLEKYRDICLELVAETWGSKDESKNS